MAKTSKERIAEKRAREDEYKRMRQALLEIVEAADTTNADRIAAINTIYKMDAEGVPLPQGWEIKPRISRESHENTNTVKYMPAAIKCQYGQK